MITFSKRLLPLFLLLNCIEVNAKSNYLYPEMRNISRMFTLINDDIHQPTDSIKHQTLVPYLTHNGKYVFVDSASMQPISHMEYDNCTFFHEDLAAVEINNKYGFVNRSGKLIIPVKYENATIFSEGLCGVKWNGKWGFINQRGEVIIPNKYQTIRPFKDGLAAVYAKEESYEINKNGNKVEDEAMIIWTPSDYWVKPNQTELTEVLQTIIEGVNPEIEDLIPDRLDGKYGYKDQKDSVVVQYIYDMAYPFEGNYAKVEIGQKIGVINRIGKLIIPTKFDEIEHIGDEMFKVGIGKWKNNNNSLKFEGKWGIINSSCYEILRPIYDYVWEFQSGFAKILLSDQFFFVDKSGRVYKK